VEDWPKPLKWCPFWMGFGWECHDLPYSFVGLFQPLWSLDSCLLPNSFSKGYDNLMLHMLRLAFGTIYVVGSQKEMYNDQFFIWLQHPNFILLFFWETTNPNLIYPARTFLTKCKPPQIIFSPRHSMIPNSKLSVSTKSHYELTPSCLSLCYLNTWYLH
jgi:hypothetical protein